MEFQGWICQRIGDAEIRQAGPDRAKKHPRRSCSRDDGSADHHVIAGLDETARRDVGQLGINRPIQVVDLEQAYAGSVIPAPDDDRVSPGIDYSPKRRFEIVGRRQPAVDNLLSGQGVVPIVIGREELAGGTVNFDDRIGQRSGHRSAKGQSRERSRSWFCCQ